MKFPSEKEILKNIDKILRKLTKLPIYLGDIVTYENFKILKSSNKILLTSELLALFIITIFVNY